MRNRFGAVSARTRREADRFLAALLGTAVVRRRSPAAIERPRGDAEPLEPWSCEDAREVPGERAPPPSIARAEPPEEAATPEPSGGPAPTPAAAACARDVAVTDTVAVLVTTHAPLPVTPAETRRIAGNAGARDDYKSVCAIVPAAPESRLLVFFHGNNNFVTVAPSRGTLPRAVARVPRWVDAPPPLDLDVRRRISGSASAAIDFRLGTLGAAQRDLSAPALASLPVKEPLVLVPEDAERTEGRFWSVPPRGQYGSHKDGTPSGPGTTRLQDLVAECYEHLRCLSTPSGRPYLAPGMASAASFAGNVRRVYLAGHSGGGKPLVESAGADMVLVTSSSATGTGGRAAELWLFDCTYGFGIHNYVNFCTNWHATGRLAYRPDAARLVCVYRARSRESDTETEADRLRTAIAGVLKVGAASLLKLHDDTSLSSPSMTRDVIPALTSSPVVFVRTRVGHNQIPTLFTTLLLRTAAS